MGTEVQANHLDQVEEPKPPVTGDIIKGKYTLSRKLGEGGFGAVYEVHETKTGHDFALKVDLEPSNDFQSSIKLEAGMLKLLKGKPHVVQYHDSGWFGPYRYVIMELAGRNIDSLRRHCPKRCFTTSTTVRICLQSLEAIKDVHDSNYVHRDIKGSNFAMGRSETDRKKLYILDFGLVRRYRLRDGIIRPPRVNPGFRGTIRYASINAHKNLEIGRNDDLISLMYMIIECCTGKLKWRKSEDVDTVGALKATISEDELFQNLEPEFVEIYRNLLSLKYESIPPYSFYEEQLKKIIARKKYDVDAPFDWDEGGAHYKQTKNVTNQPYMKHAQIEMHEKRTPLHIEEEISKDESSESDVNEES